MLKDYPFKYKVQVEFKNNHNFTEPSILYYHVSTTEEDLKTEVTYGQNNDILSEEISSEMSSNYIKSGKEINDWTVTSTGFTLCVTGYGNNFRESPVTEYVYKHLQDDFKHLFAE